MPKAGSVYIMTNKPFGVLYIGVSARLHARVFSHKSGTGSDFCREWDLRRLVHVEHYDQIGFAIAREKALKKWKRVWKLRLISEANPEWRDLADDGLI
jgi:putative endonuclease